MRVVQVVGIELSAASSETAPVTAAVLAAFPLRAIVDRYKPDALTLVEELVGLMHRPDESLADALRRAASPEPRQPRRHVRPEQLERLRELLTEADATGNSHRRTAYARHVLSEEMGYEIPKRTIDNWRQKIERGAK